MQLAEAYQVLRKLLEEAEENLNILISELEEYKKVDKKHHIALETIRQFLQYSNYTEYSQKGSSRLHPLYPRKY